MTLWNQSLKNDLWKKIIIYNNLKGKKTSVPIKTIGTPRNISNP